MVQSKWSKPKVIFLFLFWTGGIIGAGIFFYGIYQDVFLQNEEYFRWVLTGIAVGISGNLIGLIAGKILNRNRGRH